MNRRVAFALGCVAAVGGTLGAQKAIETVQRARVHASAGNLRTVATAVEVYVAETKRVPDGTTVADLDRVLRPKYATKLVTRDAWGTPFRYECWPKGACTTWAIASAGADRRFDGIPLMNKQRTRTCGFDDDLVFGGAERCWIQFPSNWGGC